MVKLPLPLTNGKKVALTVLIILLFLATAHASWFDFFTDWFDSDPGIIASYATPLKVFPGQELTIAAEVESEDNIIFANANFYHENGFDEVPMKLIASQTEKDRYSYQAKWKVHSTKHEKWYKTIITFTDSNGDVVNDTVVWQDPAVSHTANEIYPGNFSTGNFKIDGNLGVAGAVSSTAWPSQSLGTDGFAKIGSLLLQWGDIPVTVENAYNVTFPTPFSTIFNIQCTTGNDFPFRTDENNFCQVVSLGTTFSTIAIQYTNTQADDADDIFWFAIGT